VKDPICIIASAGENIDALLGETSVAEAAPAAGPATVVEEEAAPALENEVIAEAKGDGKVFASPAARRVAREHGIDIAALAGKGTGPNGRIVEKDVLNYLAASPKTTPLAGKIARKLVSISRR